MFPFDDVFMNTLSLSVPARSNQAVNCPLASMLISTGIIPTRHPAGLSWDNYADTFVSTLS